MSKPSFQILNRRRVNIDGVRVHYLVAGRRAAGMPVVCIPAPGESSGSLAPLARALAEHHLCYVLDLPGHGRSGNPPYGRRDPSRWLLAWLERLRFEHCHLITVDGSVGVVSEAAQAAPRQLSSLTMIGPPPVRRTSLVSDTARAVGGGLSPTTHSVRSLAARVRSRTANDFRRAMEPRDLEGDLARLPMPLLVVRGECDKRISREEASSLARRARGTFIELPGAPRNCHITHARAIATTLDRYWVSLEHDEPAGGSGAETATSPTAGDGSQAEGAS